jgi:hypothetical protein
LLVDVKVIVMDSTTLLLLVVPLVLGFAFNAVKFMRFIGFVASGGRKSNTRGRDFTNQMSFDERVAERLRELDRDRRP